MNPESHVSFEYINETINETGSLVKLNIHTLIKSFPSENTTSSESNYYHARLYC